MLQIEAFAALLDLDPGYRESSSLLRLVLIGGVRNAADQKIVDGLQARITQLQLEVPPFLNRILLRIEICNHHSQCKSRSSFGTLCQSKRWTTYNVE